MSLINVGIENSIHINLHYEDLGAGKPVVLIHGWPLSGASWEKQIAALLATGHRVITYDRRGFGRSTQPSTGYEYDTLAEDLHKILVRLDISDATIVGFSMGGGEVARYLGTYGSERVSKAVFIGAVPPFLLKTADNPDGVDGSVFEGKKQGLLADRPAYLSEFFKNFYNFDVLGGEKISEEVLRYSWNIAVAASPKASLDCITAFSTTDFRPDIAKIEIPTLVIHGDADHIVPLDITSRRIHASVKNSQLVVVEGAPHGLIWTHAEQVNAALLTFLAE